MKHNRALMALTTAAMALPGMMQPAQAAAPAERAFNMNASYYTEDEVAGENTSDGESSERYDIEVIQAQYSMPIGSSADLVVNAAADFMSGASPWWIEPRTGDEKPVAVMSGATIEDERVDITAKSTYYMDSSRLSGTVGYSGEADYNSMSLALEGMLDVNNKMTTLALGASLSDDTIEPTEGGELLRPEKEDKSSYGVYAGITQILDRNALFQFNLTYSQLSGYLSDPYKWVYIESLDTDFAADTRPEDRSQLAALMRYRRFFPGLAGALHLDYRFYNDDWGINSHMVETNWYQNVGAGWQVIPMFRYYVQTEADFYSVYYVDERDDGYYSSDYRLSPYGAISLGVKVDKDFGKDWNLNFGLERYMSSADYSYEDIQVENPALLDFWTGSVGFGFKF